MLNYHDIYCGVNNSLPVIKDSFEREVPYLQYADCINPVLSELIYNEGFRPVYKDGKKYGVCISHDIDFIYEPQNKNAFSISLVGSLKQRKWKEAKYDLQNIISKQANPKWALDYLLEIEQKHKFRASYYFLALSNGEQDYNYEIESMKPYFLQILNAGSEIGLHGGHKAYCSKEKICLEKAKLESALGNKVVGYRNHYLRFINPDTWLHLQDNNFEYDTTYGLYSQIGYRNGMCYPFRPYIKGQYASILELPLLVMDISFIKYMGLDIENAFKLFQKIHQDAKKYNGVLTIVWHNNCVEGDYGKLYQKIIQAVTQDEDAWITTSLEMVNWWKEYNLAEMEKIVSEKILQSPR